jgi:predicted secreted Zn-dependent protease
MRKPHFKEPSKRRQRKLSPPFFALQLLSLVMTFLGAIAGESVPSAKAHYKLNEPDTAVKKTTYKITGNSVQELKAHMNELGPVDKNKRHHDAYTTWYVTWNFDCGNFGSASRAERIRVKVEVKYIFPKWEPPGNAPAELVKKWNVYTAALQKHEDGHRDIGLQAAREILDKLESLPSALSCQEVGRAVNETGQKILNLHRQTEVKYDLETRHGATQGALLK